MPRPISWQSDLNELHRRVSDSPRSLYAREDLERLFGVQERAAQRLLGLMPRVRQANSVVVEREALLEFLRQAKAAEDLGAFLTALRRHPPQPSRRKLRLALPAQLEAGNLQSIDRWSIELRRGRITLHFTTLDDVVAKLYQLAKVIDAPEFERRFCDPPAAPPSSELQLQLQAEAAMIRAHNRFFVKTAAAAQADARPEFLPAVAQELRAEAAAALEEYRRHAQQLGLVPEDLEARARHLPGPKIGPAHVETHHAGEQTGT